MARVLAVLAPGEDGYDHDRIICDCGHVSGVHAYSGSRMPDGGTGIGRGMCGRCDCAALSPWLGDA